MNEFYKRKVAALSDERSAHIRVIERALGEIKAGDETTTTAANIISAATRLVQIHAEMNAYAMAAQIAEIKQ